MPMQCVHCGHVEDGRGETCPDCGSAMHFTLLAALPEDITKDEEFEEVKGSKPPGVMQRVGQCVALLVWNHILTYTFLFCVMMYLGTQKIEPGEFIKETPGKASIAVLVATSLGIGLGTALGGYGIYLGQLVGAVAGLLTGIAVVAEHFQLGIVHPWYAWIALPVAGTIVGFLCGLWVAGELEVRQEVKFKPVETWDNKTQATITETGAGTAKPIRQIIIGVMVGVGFPYIAGIFIRTLMAPMFPNAATLEARARQLDYPMVLIGILFCGVFAGAMARSGKIQGLLAGVAIFMANGYLRPTNDTAQIIIGFAVTVTIATIGGVVGQKIFHPMQSYANTAPPPPEVQKAMQEIERSAAKPPEPPTE